MNFLELKDLAFAWPGQPPLWEHISLTVAPGENIGLMGPNGRGKTTLFRCVTGLLAPDSGTIVFQGRPMITAKDFQQLRQVVGFALQHAEEQLIFPEVEEDICFGPLNLGLPPNEARDRAKEALDLLGISHLTGRNPFQLSGGEQRLAALAGILAMRPQLMLLDEPLAGLDERAGSRMGDILRWLPCAKIIAAHDANFLERHCSRIYTLTAAGLVEKRA